MNLHANAKLGLAGRRQLVRAIESGSSMRAAAVAFGVSPTTAHRWWHRALAGESLVDRSSRPRRQPRRLSAEEEEAVILRARRETNLGPGRLAGIVHRSRSTIWKVLYRHGLSRRPRGERQTFGHCVIDDHSRLAYVELHPREDAETNARTLERALRFYAEPGLDPPEAVMTDNAFVYRHGHRFNELLRTHAITHILTPPYTPRWNGKAERSIRTLQDEWAYSRTWPNSSARARSLQSFIRYYNRRRPHSSIGDRPPISRIHNVRGQDI